MSRSRVAILATVVLAAGCARRSEPPAGSSAPPSTSPVVVAAAHPSVTQAPLGRSLLGTWDIFPTGVAGPHLSITIDSAGANTFRGQISRVLAGDVILDADRFRRFTGTIDQDSLVSISISWVEKGVPPVEMSGKFTGAEWHLSRFVWGGQQQVLPGRTWTVRKEK